MSADFEVVPAGDAAFFVEFANRLDAGINRRVVALWHAIERLQIPGVLDLVPAYRNLCVYFDPLRTDVDRLVALLTSTAASIATPDDEDPDLVRIPVCYGGEFGQDLEAVAEFAGLTVEEVIEAHTAPTYRVFMLGFTPGFAYMGTVDDRIAAPRRTTPRLRVPAGSVGIAGPQTGIYPSNTPGGWMLVGRTPLRPYDPARAPAFLLKPGDRVRFEAVSLSDYARLTAVIGG